MHMREQCFCGALVCEPLKADVVDGIPMCSQACRDYYEALQDLSVMLIEHGPVVLGGDYGNR